MARNTHYHVLQDGPTSITEGNSLVLSWNPSNDIVLDSQTLSPVLSYRADPSNNANNLNFKVAMQNQTGGNIPVGSFTLSGTVSRTVFEVLTRSGITKDSMRFIFEVGGGVGNVSISDVIVWFHREVD